MSSSYRMIFKSTYLIGGASLISGSIRLVQNKIIAVLLGVDGVALQEIYNSIINLVSSIVNLGLGNSGVRQIAESVADSDTSGEKISETVAVYRHIIWITGGLGVILTIVVAPWFSRWFFKSSDYAWAIGFLGIAVLLSILSSGQQCVIQGLRRISDLSGIRVLAAIGSIICSIPCYFLWRQNGIVAALIAVSAVTLLVTWFFSRKIRLTEVKLSWAEHRRILTPMLKLGVCFMISSVIMAASLFSHRLLLTRILGLEACGLYQAAFALSGLLIGFVLNAMGTDYYPRLVGLIRQEEAMARAINEQIEISLLLSVPALLGMMAFSPLLITIFYAPSFAPASDLIRLFLFGMLGQVFSWPLGYIIIAYGEGKLFVLAQLIPHSLHLLLLYIGIRTWGVQGAVLSLFCNYLFFCAAMILLIRFRYGIRLAPAVILISVLALAVLCLTYWISLVFGIWIQLGINTGIGIVVGLGCLYILTRRLNFPLFAKLKKRLKHE